MKELYLNLRITAISIAMALFFLFATTPGSQAQDIVKVKTDGQDYQEAQDHLTWDDATSDLQGAIDDLAGSGGGEIWVEGGTYKPTLHFSADPETEDQLTDPSDRYFSFVIREDVTVRGGFMGDETDISERPSDLFQAENTTILSGDVGAEDDPSDNSYHVVIFPLGTSELAILDGFMITGGNANDGTQFNGRGGGIHARRGGYIINSQITGNNAGARGGGAYFYRGGLIENCTISDNQAHLRGGGIFLNQGGEVTHSGIYSNACTSESEGNGGGVFLTSNSGSHGLVTYSAIIANQSANKGGGAGIYEGSTEPGISGGHLINNLIANNEATGNGGGVHTQNAGYLLNNTIVRNQSNGGGGVFGDNGGEIINSVLWGNTTTGYPDNNYQIQTQGTETTTADYCAIENGTEESNISNLISLESGNEGTAGHHPFFVNPATFSGSPQDAGQEEELKQSSYEMALQSALIDGGNPNTPMEELKATDLLDNPRVTQQTIDIGAYETYYHIVTTEVVDGTNGTIAPDQETKVLNEESIQFTLVPEDNNEVISFEINNTEYKNDLTETTDGYVFTMETVTENLEAVVSFGIPDFLPAIAPQNIQVYPNPAEQQLFIEGVVINKIKIYSTNGKTIKDLQNPSSGINVSDLKKGMYLIEIQDENERRHIRRFIKN